MDRSPIRNNIFHRIGNTYGSLIDADHFLGRPSLEGNWLTKPTFNLRRVAEGYEIGLALPGFRKEEIDVSEAQGVLHVKAIAKRGSSAAQDEYLHMGFQPDKQERAIPLPGHADVAHIQAHYENGLLTILIPLLKEHSDNKASRILVT